MSGDSDIAQSFTLVSGTSDFPSNGLRVWGLWLCREEEPWLAGQFFDEGRAMKICNHLNETRPQDRWYTSPMVIW